MRLPFELNPQIFQTDLAEQEALEMQEQQRIAALLQLPLEMIVGDALYWMMGENEAAIHQYWVEKPWKKGIEDDLC
ncbi:hypothetical protein WN53_03330 [Serratia fonticola]|jgi:hypothetical protein|uniref:hypothetical protein n=1 Tax=Serratia fonticola TaxID=47917 RepID=UPI0003FE5E7B|nr:hypothetical protein [Serratia fonticola]AKG68239.1 hypothetical protein WN53_03330 [Serratia fonticola]CAI1523007.1 Uncharacterised protein [Serratia fonticola]